ncbi:MAG: hypothetical protein OEY20_06275 [Gemmatimonadota bacterium]|nr:hypothetical protein [Gemmatimonadota bacterium]
MALTPARIAALALVAAAAAVTVLFPPPPQRLERTGTYERMAISVAGRSLRSARQAVAVRMMRDSARRVAGPNAAGTVQTLFRGDWSPGERDWLDARVRDIRGTEPGTGNAVVAFVRDTALFGFLTLHYALPTDRNDACVAIYARNPKWARGRPLYRPTAPALLGPCAYYARFGQPGPAVDDWLHHGGAALAITSPTYPPPVRATAQRADRGRGLLALMEGSSWWAVDQRLEFPLALNACRDGDATSCRAFVTGPREGDRALQALGVHSEQSWVVEARTATFLSDVLTEIGPERFAAFWGASGTLDEAFQGAVGTDVATWTGRWAREHLGGRAPQPTVSFATLGISLGVVATFLAIATLVAIRRRVH